MFKKVRVYIFLFAVSAALFTPAANASDLISEWKLTGKNLEIAKKANSHAIKDRWKDTLKTANSASDPIIKDIFLWRMFVAGSQHITFEQLSDFIKRHPDWPRMELLHKRAEEVMKLSTSNRDIIAWFTETIDQNGNRSFRMPSSGQGKHVLAETLLVLRKEISVSDGYIKRLIREAWIETDFTEANEKNFLKAHSKRLRASDHEERIERLLWDNQLSQATRMLPRIKSQKKALFNARIQLRRNAYGVDKAVKAVPAAYKRDEGLIFDRIRWRERKKITKDIPTLLKSLPKKKRFAKKMWKTTKKYVFSLKKDKQYALAYQLASTHGLDEKTQLSTYVEAEWLSGWLALRFNKDPRIAYEHFYKIFHKVKTPISLGRASYWAGRAAEMNKNPDIAEKWFEVAAKYPTSFYGQLATEKLGRKILQFPAPVPPLKQDENAVENSSLLKAGYILRQVYQHQLGRMFVAQASKTAKTNGQQILIGEFAVAMERPDYAIMVGKSAARNNGPIIFQAAYPTLPKFTDSKGKRIEEPELAVTHAIIRQESIFNPYARSVAGALGLMQLMPRTAKEVSRKLKLKYSKRKLTSDPTYNVTLGSYYIQDRFDTFNGSYILGIASYNAGARNVEKWVKQIGDPRKLKSVDEIVDWIETIPFNETRNYVMRVLENIQVYRFILRQHSKPYVNLSKDLMR